MNYLQFAIPKGKKIKHARENKKQGQKQSAFELKATINLLYLCKAWHQSW